MTRMLHLLTAPAAVTEHLRPTIPCLCASLVGDPSPETAWGARKRLGRCSYWVNGLIKMITVPEVVTVYFKYSVVYLTRDGCHGADLV